MPLTNGALAGADVARVGEEDLGAGEIDALGHAATGLACRAVTSSRQKSGVGCISAGKSDAFSHRRGAAPKLGIGVIGVTTRKCFDCPAASGLELIQARQARQARQGGRRLGDAWSSSRDDRADSIRNEQGADHDQHRSALLLRTEDGDEGDAEKQPNGGQHRVLRERFHRASTGMPPTCRVIPSIP